MSSYIVRQVVYGSYPCDMSAYLSTGRDGGISLFTKHRVVWSPPLCDTAELFTKHRLPCQ